MVIALVASTLGAVSLVGAPTAAASGRPVVEERPVVTGVRQPGQTLSATPGRWAGDPQSFVFTWQACAKDLSRVPLVCETIGTNDSSVRLTADEVGDWVRVVVAASSPAGTTRSISALGAKVGAPTNTTRPNITGVTAAGETLSVDTGDWANAPSGYAYQWQACTTSAGSALSCEPFGTSSSDVALGSAQSGTRVRALVTASNAAGSARAYTPLSRVIDAPVNATSPAVTGTPHVGATLSSTTGDWAGSEPSYSRAWQSCTTNPPSAATCTTFATDVAQAQVPSYAEDGYVRVIVTATNALGTSKAISRLTDRVQPQLRSTQVSAGTYHTCALTTAASVRCWGINGNSGVLDVPSDLGAVTQVDAGGLHNCAVTTTGQARCWGFNNRGQTDVPANLGTVREISAGGDLTCALTTIQKVRCWGDNQYGQTSVPANLDQVDEISVGRFHVCVVTIYRQVRCWGYNGYGSLNVPTNLGTVRQVAATETTSCAIDSAGLARCWGFLPNGQSTVPSDLGVVRQIAGGSYQTCVVTAGDQARCWGRNLDDEYPPPSDLGTIVQVSGGGEHSCAVTTVGAVRCWGHNDYGQTSVPDDLT